MARGFFAHSADPTTWSGAVLVTVLVCVVAFLLVVEHTKVKHGQIRLRHFRAPAGAGLILAMVALVAPAPGGAQDPGGPIGLPDLISDPPFIWIERDLHDADNNVVHVLTFDGFLHNIGDGALDLYGNPQIDGGVKQRVFDGTEWVEVGTPTVRFENDDGHNHFHLINAATYSLWNEARTDIVDIGSKIGFCLLDTAQIEERFEASYNIDDINYCNVDDPDATELSMGITPGWHDVYESSIRLQWVDVSNTRPGLYWVGAVIDPLDEIRESNEDNNDTVFSRNKYAVSGYVARPLPNQLEPEITLRSNVYGIAAQRAFVIVDEPENGSLSVPAGFDILHDKITYVADDGFSGTDSFSYYAHDTNTPFPFDPVVQQVQIQVDAENDDQSDGGRPDQSSPSESSAGVSIQGAPGEVTATRYDRISLALTLDSADESEAIHWYGSGLPAGLTIDQTTGEISGELTVPVETTSTIIALTGTTRSDAQISWSVADSQRVTLRAVNDFSLPQQRNDFLVGAGSAATTYRATGLPEGMLLTEGQPSLLGTATESGVFSITVDELLDGEVVDSVEFTLTVRNSTRPEFPL